MTVHLVAESLARYLSTQSGNRYSPAVLSYGLEIIIGEVIKDIILFTMAWWLDIFPHVLLATLSFASLRLVTGGAHCTSLRRCLVTTLATFLAIGYLARWGGHLLTEKVFIFLIATVIIVSGYVTIRWVPGNSENKVIDDPGERAKFKKLSFLLLGIWTGILIILFILDFNSGLILAIILAIFIQLFYVTRLGAGFMSSTDDLLEKIRV